MLEELDIRNLGPIREATIAPAAGMTAITGETGARQIHAALRDPTGLRRGRRILARLGRGGRGLGPGDFRALG